jgi:transcription antitermination factor NusG
MSNIERIWEVAVTCDKYPTGIGDRVRVACGSVFDGYEGTVVEGPLQNGKLRIELTVFGRKVTVVLDQDQMRLARP